MSTKTINILLLLLLMGAVAYLFIRQPTKEVMVRESVVYRDSVVRDTLRDTTLKIVTQYVVRYDTLAVNDTIYKLLPISRYEFSDTSYRFTVEGYNVKPILLETYPITHYITTERTKEVVRERRINHGLNVGVGAFFGTKGFDVGVYVGYGFTINLNKK